jgi:Alpha amylase, catalytic domain.
VNLMMLLTLKGTPFLYNGEEFGMSDVQIDSLKDFVDPVGLTYYRLEKKS